MQLGTFKSVLGGFLSQLGFAPWPSGAFTPEPVPNTPGTRTMVVGFHNRVLEIGREKRSVTIGRQPRRPEFIS